MTAFDPVAASEVEAAAPSNVLVSQNVLRSPRRKHPAVLKSTTQAWVVVGTFSDSDMPFILRIVALDRVAAQAAIDALNCLLAAEGPQATIHYRAASLKSGADPQANVVIVATSEQKADPEALARASIQGVAPDAWLKVVLASAPSVAAGPATESPVPHWLHENHELFPLLCLNGDGPDGNLRALSATIYSILAIPFLPGMMCVGLGDLAYMLSRRVSRYATAAFESFGPGDSEAQLVERCWSKAARSDQTIAHRPRHSFLIRFADNSCALEDLEAMGEALGERQSVDAVNQVTTRVSPTRLNCLPKDQGAWLVLALPLEDTGKANFGSSLARGRA